MRGNAICSLRIGQAEDRIRRTARLERTGFLPVLAFEELLRPSQIVEERRHQHRRLVDVGSDPIMSCDEVVIGWNDHAEVLHAAALDGCRTVPR